MSTQGISGQVSSLLNQGLNLLPTLEPEVQNNMGRVATVATNFALFFFSMKQPLFYLGLALGIVKTATSTFASSALLSQARLVDNTGTIGAAVISLIFRNPAFLMGSLCGSSLTRFAITEAQNWAIAQPEVKKT